MKVRIALAGNPNSGKTTMKKWIEKHPEKGFKYLN